MNTVGQTLWRNLPFQRLFWAHVVSLVGSGLSSVALGLLAHQLVGASASAVLGITLAIRIIVIVLLIGNRFWPFGALARSLKLEALISMPGCCQMGL